MNVYILPMEQGILLRRWEVGSRTLLLLWLMAELQPTAGAVPGVMLDKCSQYCVTVDEAQQG